MSDQTDKLREQVKAYGLPDDEASIYLHLLNHGPSTALTLSRDLEMGRTKIYRLLDKLSERQLIEIQIDERGMKFASTDPSKFENIISEQEMHISQLKESLPNLVALLNNFKSKSSQNSKVLYYEGIEGLKQVSYNIIRAKGLLRVFEMEHLSEFLPRDFSENIRRQLVENKIVTKDLTNKTSFSDFTDITELIKDYSEFRYIDPKKLAIEFEVLIYNDVYATYSYKNEKIFCVEIYNKELADMQKQIFDFIWNEANPMKFVSEKGAAEVIK